MRIAFDYQIFASQEFGGISRYFTRLAKEVAKIDEVKVIAPLYINQYLGDLPANLVFGKYVRYRRGLRRLAIVLDRYMQPKVMEQYRPDIIHHTYYEPSLVSKSNAVTVLTVYDMIHEKFPMYFDDRGEMAEKKRIAIQQADHIICISESTRNDVLDRYPSVSRKLSVTHLGFDHPIISCSHVRNKNKPFLLFVGQRGGYKNFQALLEAFASSALLKSSFDLVAVGGGPFVAAEARAISHLGLDARVSQHTADDRALHHWYREASVFVYPSLYEGFGIPPLEAMAADTPVVAVNVSSIPEVCGDAAAYAENGEAGALRNAIETVAFSSDYSDNLRAAGRRRLQHFSWEKCGQQTAAIYRGLK